MRRYQVSVTGMNAGEISVGGKQGKQKFQLKFQCGWKPVGGIFSVGGQAALGASVPNHSHTALSNQ